MQLTIPWAVPHSQEAARLAHDDIAAKLGVGAAKSFLRDEASRLSREALAPKSLADEMNEQLTEPARMPEGCTHPKPWTFGNAGVVKCAKCGAIRGRHDIWRKP